MFPQEKILDLPTTYRSLRWYAPEQIQLDEIPLKSPGWGEVLVKIGAATTCGTDFKTFKRGHARLIREIPAPFGHEMAGTVVALGAQVSNFKEGDRVVVGNSAPCGSCFYCQKQSWSLCEDLLFLNGAYADFLTVPARIVQKNLHPIPDSLDFSVASLSEPLACVLNAWEKVNPRPGEKLALLGAGPMGVLFAQLAQLQGVEMLVLGRDKKKLENLRQFGVREIISLTEDDHPLQKAKEFLHGGRGADVVIEAVGLPETWKLAVDLARPGGRVCFYGGCSKGTEVSLDTYRLHYEELELFGVFHHTPAIFARAVEYLAQAKIQTQGLIVGEIRLGEFARLFKKGIESNPLKWAVIP